MLMFYLQMIESEEDKSKFETVYLEYRGLMYQISYNILENIQDAEDAVHQAFLYIADGNMRKIDKAVSPQTKSYLVNLVECRAINIKSQRDRRLVEIPYNDIDDIAGISTDYGGSDEVSRCLSKLPARYREVLIFKYKFGFDNKAIAKMFGISIEALWKLEQRARDRLFELCRGEGVL